MHIQARPAKMWPSPRSQGQLTPQQRLGLRQLAAQMSICKTDKSATGCDVHSASVSLYGRNVETFLPQPLGDSRVIGPPRRGEMPQILLPYHFRWICFWELDLAWLR